MDPAQLDVLRAQAERKSPVLLWILNILWPGLGNIVVGQIAAGVLFGVLHWPFIAIAIVTHGLGGFLCFGNWLVASAVGHHWINQRYAKSLAAIQAKYSPSGGSA
jgi:TM2 domain-containing membrane protein YozV